jgi:protease-4
VAGHINLSRLPGGLQVTGQKLIGWCLVAAAVLAVPVGLMSRSTTHASEKTDAEETSSPFQSLVQRDRIQVVKLYGVISDDGESGSFLSSASSIAYAKKKLRKAITNDHVKAILLRVNSPGGSIGMSQELYSAVQELRKKGKPVVVSMGDVAASGGYYVSAPADRIFANAGTLTGSIGVIMHLMNWQETEKKIGFQPQVIKSGAFKDIGSPDRPITPEEKAMLQALIMDAYDQFVTAVADGRKIDKATVKTLADGRIYSGAQALQKKLVDELGGYDQALAYLQKTCKDKYSLKKDLPVDDGSSSSELIASLLSSIAQPAPTKSQAESMLKQFIPVSMNPEFNKVPLWLME